MDNQVSQGAKNEGTVSIFAAGVLSWENNQARVLCKLPDRSLFLVCGRAGPRAGYSSSCCVGPSYQRVAVMNYIHDADLSHPGHYKYASLP